MVQIAHIFRAATESGEDNREQSSGSQSGEAASFLPSLTLFRSKAHIEAEKRKM